jgi:hypothetical protein
MANKTRLVTQGGAWAGAAGAIVGDNLNSGITALAGGANGASTPLLTGDANIIATCATTADSVKLPTGQSTGDELFLRNNGAASANVFPPTGGKINNGSTDAAAAVGASKTALFKSIGTLDWLMVLTA